MNVTTVLPILKLILTFGNICVLGYAQVKFLNKPHTNLETRVSNLEFAIKEANQSLHQGNDRFKELDGKFTEQDRTNEILIRSVFALLEFEVHYCETEQKPITKNLERAKDDLHDFLAGK